MQTIKIFKCLFYCFKIDFPCYFKDHSNPPVIKIGQILRKKPVLNGCERHRTSHRAEHWTLRMRSDHCCKLSNSGMLKQLLQCYPYTCIRGCRDHLNAKNGVAP